MSATESLPFTWLTVEQLTAGGSPFASKSSLYAAIRARWWPAPTRIGGRSLWRSDEVTAANERIAAQAELESGAKARAAAERADRLIRARRAPIVA